ncbi:MAG: DedA family protein, partial [Sandarakinorhabdus sp.]
MADALTVLFKSILDHRHLAGPAFGLLALGESLVIIGTFIPATPILFLVGTLLGSGALDPLAILPWALAGAIVGYWASWRLGRRSGPLIYASRRFRPYRREIARTRLFFRRWGGPSLVIGRFVLGPFQSMLPFVAGVAEMPMRRFHLWNSLSSTLWV